MKVNYEKIVGIPKLKQDSLILDFAGVDFLNTFEITELFEKECF
jgi:hypothetical protein